MLSIEQWDEIRDALTELEQNLQDLQEQNSPIPPATFFQEVRNALKPMVYNEEYRKTVVALIKHADTLGLSIEAEDDGQIVIFTGLGFKPVKDDDKESIQTYNDLCIMDDDDGTFIDPS
jgi:hypothetical protein